MSSIYGRNITKSGWPFPLINYDPKPMSTPKKKPIKPRGKQHDTRAASLKRIAHGVRGSVKASHPNIMSTYDLARIIAHELDIEAKLLRSML